MLHNLPAWGGLFHPPLSLHSVVDFYHRKQLSRKIDFTVQENNV